MMRGLVVALTVARSSAACVDANSAEHLSMAIDAAIMELQGQKGWFHELRASSGYPDAMSVYSCTPDADKWEYPSEADAKGVLARVLRTGTLRVAGVQWANGGAADYKTDPLNPSGFWPKYMDAIVSTMAAHYAKPISLERVYYVNSALVVDAVAQAEDVDMSEPYYYLSGFHGNTPRIESLAFSCVTAGLASSFFTPKGSGVTSVDELYTRLAGGPNRAVGFIGQGNYDAVSAMLPESVSPTYVTNSSDMVANVLSGALVAGYVSEGTPPSPELFDTFETGIVSPRGASA